MNVIPKTDGEFPGGSVIKYPPANAFDPWSEMIPHAVERLSPY